MRDRPGRLLKQLDQKAREAALVDKPMGWFVAMAGEMDMGAARGGIDTQWVPFAPYLPPRLFEAQRHNYRLRFGHLPTTIHLMRGYEAPYGYGWLRDALCSQADKRGITRESRVKQESGGPDGTCPLCCSYSLI